MADTPAHADADTRARPLVLGIESSCDDTACAIVDGAGRVLASVVSSQLEQHRPYGGVVPEIASREHLKNWPAVSHRALGLAGIELGDIDAVAATSGPGLVGSLLVGLSLGKAIAYGLDRPFFATHHLEGHLYSPYLREDGAPAAEVPEQFVGLVASGGHTSLIEVAGSIVTTLGETTDDAVGEAFDKLGKRVGLRFPGGPEVDKLAESSALTPGGRFRLPRQEGIVFSYSGLKSAALREVEALERAGVDVDAAAANPTQELLQLLVDFRQAAVNQIINRLERLHRERAFGHLAVSGGVAANRELRRQVVRFAESRGVELALVPLVYAGDNAAMIAHAALRRYRRGESDPLDADVFSRGRIGAVAAS